MALTKSDFEKMVLEPGIVRVMHESGVNVDVLAEMLDLVWEADLVTVTVTVPLHWALLGTAERCKEK